MKQSKFIFLLLLLFSVSLNGQGVFVHNLDLDESDYMVCSFRVMDSETDLKIDKAPYLKSCHDSAYQEECTADVLFKFIQSEIRYPISAIDNEIEADLLVTLNVSQHGIIGLVSIENDKDGLFSEEVRRVVQSVKDGPFEWIPATRKGVYVPSDFSFEMAFHIE